MSKFEVSFLYAKMAGGPVLGNVLSEGSNSVMKSS